MKLILVCWLFFCFVQNARADEKELESRSLQPVVLTVLGIAQDAGYPQANCYRKHCMRAWENPAMKRLVTSIAIVDRNTKQKFLFEATPDIKEQLYQLHLFAPQNEFELSGIILTHGHMGHYSGLMHLGREAAGAKSIPVYAMPRMSQFLSRNGPWSQLVKLNNIELQVLANKQTTKLNENLKIIPLLVPHRDEYTETVGYKIIGPNKTALFIPDIDKWNKWSTSIVKLVKSVDYAFLDATFYAADELPNRDMSDVPHPFVPESMRLFEKLDKTDKIKIIFIHFNHTNPLLIDGSEAQKYVIDKGFRVAKEGMQLEL